ncbi:MAG: hypothetical protein AYK22_02060 [Thermoplasmatales archaeon SG8-52-3]|nr:MAG: hypothetical protein AYK22_02060 [Thermoplasmatales archaeon SG8-52-3]
MKKYIAFSIFILVLILAFTPYIKAVYISDQENIDSINYKDKGISEVSNQGFDLAIIDIVPYIWNEGKGLSGELHLTLEIKNVGDSSTTSVVRYYGNSSLFISKNQYGSAWGALLLGSLDPGETWIPKSEAGLLFLNFIPRIFYVEYEVFPLDSNPDNNYIKQVYLVRGGGIFPFWKHLPFLE